MAKNTTMSTRWAMPVPYSSFPAYTQAYGPTENTPLSDHPPTVQPNCVHKGCSKAGNVNTTLMYQLQAGQVPGKGANTGLRLQLRMLSEIVHVYQCTSYDELVRLCSFGSLVLWISLRSPSDLLYKLNCHVEK